MAGAPVGAEGDDHLRSGGAQVADDVGHHGVLVGVGQAAVGEAAQVDLGEAEGLAGVLQLALPDGRHLLRRPVRVGPLAPGGAVQAHVAAAGGVEGQRAPHDAGLVVGMGEDGG